MTVFGDCEIIPADSHLQVWDGGMHFIKLNFLCYPFFSYSVYHTAKVQVVVFFPSVLPVEAPFPSAVGILWICLSNTETI